MKMKVWKATLQMAHEWTIASGVNTGGKHSYETFLVELTDGDGLIGLGECSPPSRYKESPATAQEFFNQVDASKLSFNDIPGTMAYLDTVAPGNYSAKGAI